MQLPDDPSRPAAAMTAAGRPARRRRPAPVTILAAIEILSGIGYLATLLFLLGISGAVIESMQLDSIQAIQGDMVITATVIAMLAVLTVVAFAAAILLLRMKQLGWTMTMLVTGLSLSSQIFLYVTQGDLVPVLMLTSVITVLYLNQRQVRTAFGIGHPADDVAAELEERA